MSERTASYEQFLKRYEDLKGLYFSPKSDPRYDEDGEEIPSAFLTKGQIAEIFVKEMKVHPPSHRQDPPKFFDGSIGPGYVAPRQKAPPARLVQNEISQPPPIPAVQEESQPIPELDRRPALSLKAKPKMIHCGTHGKVLAIVMDDDVLMCETCYKNQNSSEDVGVYF